MLSECCINRRLTLREMSLSVNTAEVLRDFLCAPNKISHLDLCKNLLGDRGIIILTQAFLKSTSLVTLNIGSNEITTSGMSYFFKQLV